MGFFPIISYLDVTRLKISLDISHYIVYNNGVIRKEINENE